MTVNLKLYFHTSHREMFVVWRIQWGVNFDSLLCSHELDVSVGDFSVNPPLFYRGR